jgi:hypothetical protein
VDASCVIYADANDNMKVHKGRSVQMAAVSMELLQQ